MAEGGGPAHGGGMATSSSSCANTTDVYELVAF